MNQPIATSTLRRTRSSRRGTCARGALGSFVFLGVALAGSLLLQSGSDVAVAQELQLTPSETRHSEGIATPGPEQRSPAAPDAKPLPPQDDTTGVPQHSIATGAVVPAGNRAPATASKTDLTEALERRGDLTLRNSSIEGALFTIGELWHVNIVVGEVKGTVNGVFKNAPLREILDSILLSNGYSYRPVGDSLVVSPLAQLGQINPFFKSATITVESADIDEIVEGAKLLSTPTGQVRAIKSARSIFVLDFPDRVQMIRDFVTAIDTATRAEHAGTGVRSFAPLEVGYFRTNFITAKTAEDALVPILSKEGRCSIMEKEDRLLVSDYAENLAMVESVLSRIDRPRPQVRITALIYDLSLQDIQQLGINWGSAIKSGNLDAKGIPQTSLGIDSVTQVPFPAGAAGSTLTFLNLSKYVDIRAVVLALNNTKDSRLLSDPSVAVMENEEAVFQNVSEIPYQQLTQTSQGGNIGTTAFKEAGVTLRVKPKISGEGVIRMEVSPEFSRLTGFTPGDNQPIIDKRTATTTLNVANGQTIVIGGLRQRDDVGDFKGIPYLKDMRVVGNLFRSRNTDVRESELVVFICPEVITPDDPVNHRQQMIVDTLGCRLNMIPEAEGCPPPPCPCGPPTAGAPQILHGPCITAAPTRLPVADAAIQTPDSAPAEPSNTVAASQPVQTAPMAGGQDTLRQTVSAGPDAFPLAAQQPVSTPPEVINLPREATRGTSPQLASLPASSPPLVQSPRSTRLPAVEPALAPLPILPTVSVQSSKLFDAPPQVNLGLPSDDDSQVRIGGAVQVGIRH
jgi:general secretion pathway protein D